MIGLSRIWRIRKTRCRPGGAKDECGTMKDEPKKGGSQNKPNRFNSWWVKKIDGFRPKQTQAIYLPCCQLDAAKFGLFF